MQIPAAVKAWVRDEIRQQIANALRFEPMSGASSDGLTDQVEGLDEGPGGDSGNYPAVRAEPFGHRAVPPAGVNAAFYRVHGGANSSVIVGTQSSDYGPLDLAVGEVAIYNKVSGCVIKLDENGTITIAAPALQTVAVTGDTVYLGAVAGSQFVALANRVLSELQAIATAYNNHTHVETGTTTNPVIVAQQYVAGSVGASQTKAK